MSDKIKFILNGEYQEIANISPTTTVLEYIRNHEKLTGTKEGCAEGDCGACTVVLAEPKNGKLEYKAVNSCIIFLPKLHGKLLITVEGIKGKDGKLHPVQQEMIDMHGSQCGFCTPGFIMTLFAYYHADVTRKESDDEIHELIAGNLCRCTGYRPIVEAAHAVAGKKIDWYSENEKSLIEKLETIRKGKNPEIDFNGKKYFSPTSLKELSKIMEKHPKAFLLAGGTDLGLLVTKANRELDEVVHTSNVSELLKIEETKDFIEIGASVTYTEALPIIEKNIKDFGKLIRRIGSTQIRNLGTMGGNIANASPIGDSSPCLIALGASLVLNSSKGKREVKIDEFFTGYRQTVLQKGEFIEAIKIPKLKSHEIFKAYKVTKRFDQDISSVCGAFKLVIEDSKVSFIATGFGGMAATPAKALKFEKAILGKEWNEKTAKAGAKALEGDFKPLTDFRASDEYRKKVASNLALRLLAQTTTNENVTEVWEL